jgi:hypothetical protein
VRPAIDTPLGKALRAHREEHQGCGLGCPEYLAIANRATAARRIYEGPAHPYTRLSVREAASA